jgi:ADP-ribosylglycohydrolase
MDDRAPGPMTEKNIARLRKGKQWFEIPYNKAGGGCGGSMRSMYIFNFNHH